MSLYRIAFLILRLITFMCKFLPISAGIKLLVEKESIEYTLRHEAASRPGYIKILLAMKGRAKDEERRSILPSPSKISQARIFTFVHLCASRRPQSTCYMPPSMGKKRRKQLSFSKNFQQHWVPLCIVIMHGVNFLALTFSFLYNNNYTPLQFFS